MNDQSLEFHEDCESPLATGLHTKRGDALNTPSTQDFGSCSNSVDCSKDSIDLSDHNESVSDRHDVYGSYFDKPEATEPDTSSTSWGELTSASAALLDPNILRMFVDSLTRSITGNESSSQSILSVDEDVSTPTVAALTTRAAPQVSSPTSSVSVNEGSWTPVPPRNGGMTRSTTNMSLMSSNSYNGGLMSGSSSTVMLRNVPYDARQGGVLSLIEEEGFKCHFDFFYAPLDFKSKNNLGYAFVNFHSVEIAKEFFQRFDGKKVTSRPGWDKPLRVCWARVQGLEANIDHYRNSPVNEMPLEFKPMLFDTDGDQLPFPAPDPSIANAAGSVNLIRDESGRISRHGSSNSMSTVRPRERRLQSQLSRGFYTPVNARIGSSLLLPGGTPQPMSSVSSPNKLFVGGLSPDTSSEGLGEYMKRFGEIYDCHVLVDSTTGRSRCYGFCTYKSEDGAVSALSYTGSHWLDGRGVVVRPYTSMARQQSTNDVADSE